MKKILILAMLLTGCAGFDGQKFMQAYGDGMQAHQQQSQPLQTYMQNNPVRRTDNVCFQNCTQAHYEYGLCQSRCTY